jgi:hypothetical protein
LKKKEEGLGVLNIKKEEERAYCYLGKKRGKRV